MYKGIFNIESNEKLTSNIYKMTLTGNTAAITAPGQFVNIALDGFYLRRPISVCDVNGNELTLIYKVVGNGTEKMSQMTKNEKLDILTGLGNGFNIEKSGTHPLLIGGGVGSPPLLMLAKHLILAGKHPKIILGYQTDAEFFHKEAGFCSKNSDFFAKNKDFYSKTSDSDEKNSNFSQKNEQKSLYITTADGSAEIKGLVTDAIKMVGEYDYIYACGPEKMLQAIYITTQTDGQFSFESRMACGFGACMGCTCKTKYGSKRICRDGPVLTREEIIW